MMFLLHACLTVGGLGMRVVGGKLGPDKKLGTYVASVVKGGPASMAGIRQGRCIAVTAA